MSRPDLSHVVEFSTFRYPSLPLSAVRVHLVQLVRAEWAPQRSCSLEVTLCYHDTRRNSKSYLLDLERPLGDRPCGPPCELDRVDSPLRPAHACGIPSRIPLPNLRQRFWECKGIRVTRQGDPRQCDIQHAPMTRHGLCHTFWRSCCAQHLQRFCSIQPLAG